MSARDVTIDLQQQVQLSLEKLHELRTYAMSSSQSVRYQQLLDKAFYGLREARDATTSLALALNIEGQ